jgi:hypothetical protein
MGKADTSMLRPKCRGCKGPECDRCAMKARLLTTTIAATFKPIRNLAGDFKVYHAPTRVLPHKQSARGKRKKKNMVGIPRKGYHKEKKYASLKLVATEVGTGVAARKNFEEGECISFYGAAQVLSSANLDTVSGQKRAGLKNTSYLLATEEGWFNGGTAFEKRVGRLGSFANACTGRFTPSKKHELKPNAYYDEDPKTRLPVVRALTKIQKGEEIVTCYGWTPRTWKRNLLREQIEKEKKDAATLLTKKRLDFSESD